MVSWRIVLQKNYIDNQKFTGIDARQIIKVSGISNIGESMPTSFEEHAVGFHWVYVVCGGGKRDIADSVELTRL